VAAYDAYANAASESKGRRGPVGPRACRAARGPSRTAEDGRRRGSTRALTLPRLTRALPVGRCLIGRIHKGQGSPRAQTPPQRVPRHEDVFISAARKATSDRICDGAVDDCAERAAVLLRRAEEYATPARHFWHDDPELQCRRALHGPGSFDVERRVDGARNEDEELCFSRFVRQGRQDQIVRRRKRREPDQLKHNSKLQL